MTNWCFGKMTISGHKKDVKNFLRAGIIPVNKAGKSLNKNLLNITEDDLHVHLIVNYEDNSYLYLDNTFRGFITRTCLKIISDKDDIYSLLLDIKFLDYVASDELSEIAKQYNIDIGVEATEDTNAFTQTIAVNKVGKVMIDDIIER